MEAALQSSVYVSSPEFAGWLSKRGFRVKPFNTCLYFIPFLIFCCIVVAKTMEKALGSIAWC